MLHQCPVREHCLNILLLVIASQVWGHYYLKMFWPKVSAPGSLHMEIIKLIFFSVHILTCWLSVISPHAPAAVATDEITRITAKTNKIHSNHSESLKTESLLKRGQRKQRKQIAIQKITSSFNFRSHTGGGWGRGIVNYFKVIVCFIHPTINISFHVL